MKIAVVFVHGVGHQRHGYSHSMQKKLARYYGRLHPDTDESDLMFKEVLWAPVLKEQQNRLYSRVSQGQRLNYGMLRRFFFDYMSDAIAYQAICRTGDPTAINVYHLIHAQIETALAELAEDPAIDKERTPLVFVGHSLGSVIISNFIWDHMTPDSPLSSFESGETIAGLMTMGSPLAIWTLRLQEFGQPVALPANTTWYNFYDRSDVIATPLGPINSAFAAAVTADIPVAVGNFFTTWNPMSHMGYWSSGAVAGYIAKFLVRLRTQQKQAAVEA